MNKRSMYILYTMKVLLEKTNQDAPLTSKVKYQNILVGHT